MAQRTSDDSLIYFKPRNEAQEDAMAVYNGNTISFFLGPAGTGKTHLAIAFALMDMFPPGKLYINRNGQKLQPHMEKIVISRPIVEAGEKLGYLPGVIDEKVAPYVQPIYDCIGNIVQNPQKFIEDHVEVVPLAYMRGRTFNRRVMILDEAQNCTYTQLVLFLTRLGRNSKIIIAGDPDQSDIGAHSGLRQISDALETIPNVGIMDFDEEDIVRNPLITKILKALAKSEPQKVAS